MKKALFWVACSMILLSSCSDRYKVDVTYGYGTGYYLPGDTIHVFAEEFFSNEYFSGWSGTHTGILNSDKNWHTYFVMPNEKVELTANFGRHNNPIVYDTIQGADILKPLFYSFPTSNYKGTIFLFHGTNGYAGMVDDVKEVRTFIDRALGNGYGVVVSEAEEATLRSSGDWQWDVRHLKLRNNIDLKNFKVINDTLINRNLLDTAKPVFSMGYSNGAFFSQLVANTFGHDGIVSMIGQGLDTLYDGDFAIENELPTMWIMGENDQNTSIGLVGLEKAKAYHDTLINRGICSRFITHRRSPLHPERFNRLAQPGLESGPIFVELSTNNQLDYQFRPMIDSQMILDTINSRPGDFPVLSGASNFEFFLFQRQWKILFAEHVIVDDYSGEILDFFDKGC